MKNVNRMSLTVATVLATAGLTTTALGQVAGDEASTAVTLTPASPVAFDTTNATASANAAPSDAFCTGTFLDWGTGNKDVWFKFVPTEAGVASFSTCFAGSFDTSIVLYTGTPAALTEVACNGDGTGDTGCQNFYSKISSFGIVVGSTYYLRVGGWNGTEFGAGQVSMTFTANPPVCGVGTDGCGAVHANPGCSDAVCCNAVCANNPLCCEIGWDQSCVDSAIAACGIFVHQCVAPVAANDCAQNAIVVNSDATLSFNNTGCNTDGPNHPAATCSSGSDTFMFDVWYRCKPIANGSLRVSTCGLVSFDSKLAIYNMGTNPATYNYDTLNTTLVACNDDGTNCLQTDGVTPYASDLTINATSGNWYLIRVAGYDNVSFGAGGVFIDMPEACALPTSTGNEAEACGASTNNGCNAGGVFENIALGNKVRGTFFTAVDPTTGGNTRDTDFYKLTITADTAVTAKLYSASFASLLILGGDITTAGCAGVTVMGSGAGNCPMTATACLNPGSYYVFVATSAFTGVPCGSGQINDYVLEVTGTPSNCPDPLTTTCPAPGPNTFSLNSDPNTSTAGLVACAVSPAFPNCSGGGTTANSYARSFPAGSVGGSISCLNLGVFSIRRAVNTANTACANFSSNLPLPATIGIYQDLNGGAPTNKELTPGDGNDLRLIAERQVVVPGGAYKGTISFDPPLCLTGVTGNIVVIMDIPNLNDGSTGTIPAASGYGLRPGGNTPVGATSSLTYCRLSCADSGAYQLCESLGATFLAQWVVEMNGNFATCAGACPTDLNHDGVTGSADLATLLNGWGGTSPDLNGDGVVGSADLSTLLNAWGACP